MYGSNTIFHRKVLFGLYRRPRLLVIEHIHPYYYYCCYYLYREIYSVDCGQFFSLKWLGHLSGGEVRSLTLVTFPVIQAISSNWSILRILSCTVFAYLEEVAIVCLFVFNTFASSSSVIFFYYHCFCNFFSTSFIVKELACSIQGLSS